MIKRPPRHQRCRTRNLHEYRYVPPPPPAITFPPLEQFLLTVGGLWGQAGWVDPGGDLEPEVASSGNVIAGTLNNPNAARHDIATAGIVGDGPWTMTATFTPKSGAPGTSSFGFRMESAGQADLIAISIDVDAVTGISSATVDADGDTFNDPAAAAILDAPNELKATLLAGDLKLYLNGALLGTTPGAAPSPVPMETARFVLFLPNATDGITLHSLQVLNTA